MKENIFFIVNTIDVKIKKLIQCKKIVNVNNFFKCHLILVITFRKIFFL